MVYRLKIQHISLGKVKVWSRIPLLTLAPQELRMVLIGHSDPIERGKQVKREE